MLSGESFKTLVQTVINIDHSLASAAFFVPILTPRYFQRFECRRELQTFAREAQKLGISNLILSILWVDVAEFGDAEPQDELIALLKSLQWADWRELRFAEISSSDYRKEVAKLAKRLVQAGREIIASELPVANGASTPSSSGDEGGGGVDDVPGSLDILASGQIGMEGLGEAAAAIGEEMNSFNAFTVKAVENIKRVDHEGGGAIGRLTVAKEYARNISQPADRIKELASEYASQMYDADAGVRYLLLASAGEVERNPESRDVVCSFFRIATTITEGTRVLRDTLSGLVEGMAQNEALSRDLRPPLRVMKQGVAMIMEASSLTDEWVKIIEDSPVDCSQARTDLFT
jgi:hypothetical protein